MSPARGNPYIYKLVPIHSEFPFSLMLKSASCPADFYPLGFAKKQVPSQFKSAASYSFGKPFCGVGKFRKPPKDIRCAYLETLETPGVGNYEMDKPNPWAPKAAEYTFGISGTVRDAEVRRFTELGHVVGHGNLNNPGPARYFGGEKNSLMWRQPAYTQGSRRPAVKGYWNRPTPGPDAYSIEVRRESVGNALTRPKWMCYSKRTDQARTKRSCLIHSVSTGTNLGPGAYRHSTGLVAT